MSGGGNRPPPKRGGRPRQHPRGRRARQTLPPVRRHRRCRPQRTTAAPTMRGGGEAAITVAAPRRTGRDSVRRTTAGPPPTATRARWQWGRPAGCGGGGSGRNAGDLMASATEEAPLCFHRGEQCRRRGGEGENRTVVRPSSTEGRAERRAEGRVVGAGLQGLHSAWLLTAHRRESRSWRRPSFSTLFLQLESACHVADIGHHLQECAELRFLVR